MPGRACGFLARAVVNCRSASPACGAWRLRFSYGRLAASGRFDRERDSARVFVRGRQVGIARCAAAAASASSGERVRVADSLAHSQPQPAIPDGARRQGSIAVVVATRNRPADAARAVASILREGGHGFELCVIDQSDSDATVLALGDFQGDPRLTIVRCGGIGLGAARNLGVAQCRAEWIAFTDDDCEALPGWLAGLAAAFASEPGAAAVFGNVIAAPYDRSTGFIPAYVVQGEFAGRTIADKPRLEGIGACMAVRRGAWQALGGFDEQMGAGARFRAAEDTDFVVRALLAGMPVCETRGASVTHHGFRNWNEGLRLIDGYMYGLGAANMKMQRLARWAAVGPLATLAWRWLFGRRWWTSITATAAPRLVAFLRGARDALRTPLIARPAGLPAAGRSIPRPRAPTA